MRILYVAMKYDYGKPENGFGFEHYNFFDSLQRMGFDILYFDPLEMNKACGKEATARRLWEVVTSEKPDLMFTVLFTDELDPATVMRISSETDTVTFNWFCDDHWRFDNYSREWAPRFNFVSTTAKSALAKYQAIGYANVLKTQWAANHFRYRPQNVSLTHDVSFVGRPHGNRAAVIEAVERRGVKVATFGEGWPGGPVDHDQMLRIFSGSRINLNLSNSSVSDGVEGQRLLQLVQRACRRGGRIGSRVSGLLTNLVNRRRDPIADGADLYSQQIKGRNFEVPACGGLLLTTPADDLETYFDIGREVVVITSLAELIERVGYFLHHDDARRAIADAGLARVLAEHTYVHRFTDLFRAMFDDHSRLDAALSRKQLGNVLEVQ